MKNLFLTWIMAAVLCFSSAVSHAEYGRVPKSEFDPETMKINEEKYLGSPVEKNYAFINEKGREFTLGGMLDRPLILVLSYYSCDGVCSTVNSSLMNALSGIGLKPGLDYRTLTVSFDRNDGLESLAMFKKHLQIPERLGAAWELAVAKDYKDIESLTSGLGYNFFWSKRDRIFFHPNVLVFLSPGGRVVRYLYTAGMSNKDVELSILDASRDQTGKSNITDLGNSLLIACYSYNFKEGKYSLNYPLFIGAGSLLSGVALIGISMVVMSRKKRRTLS